MRSSRRVAQALVENVAFRVESSNQTPLHWALNRFRARRRAAPWKVLVQTASLAAQTGLAKLATVEGSPVDASRRR